METTEPSLKSLIGLTEGLDGVDGGVKERRSWVVPKTTDEVVDIVARGYDSSVEVLSADKEW